MEAGDSLRGCGVGPKVPLRMMVGWRGYGGAMASKLPIDSAYTFTEPLLGAWRIPTWRLMSDDDLGTLELMDQTASDHFLSSSRNHRLRIPTLKGRVILIERMDLFRTVAEQRTNEIVVMTMTATLQWPLVSESDLDFDFLAFGMGHAADFGLGLAIARPERKTIVWKGDGRHVDELGLAGDTGPVCA